MYECSVMYLAGFSEQRQRERRNSEHAKIYLKLNLGYFVKHYGTF